MLTPDLHLKSVVRNYIREYLKNVQPKRNLFVTIMKLNLPEILKLYLLLNTMPEKNKGSNLRLNERSLFSNSLKGDLVSIRRLVDNQ